MVRACLFVFLVGICGCATQGAPAAVTIAALPAPPPAPVAPPVMPAPPVPAHYVEVTVAGVVRQSEGAAVALTDATEETIVPIYVGGTEAASILHRFEHTSAERPLTHDLFDSALQKLAAKVVRAQVDKLEGGTYYGTLVLREGSQYVVLDARPSDAIAMALGSRAPIYCAKAVFTAAGVPRDSFEGLPSR